jgi:hypothetical protein
MSWNHRITRRSVPAGDGSEDTEHVYEIREVYYDDEGKVKGWTEEPVAPHGESVRDLLDDLAIMGRVATRPIFDIDKREDVPFREAWRGSRG